MINNDNLRSPLDPAATLFESDTLASYRYQRVFESRQISPEKRLIFAILDDAVQSFLTTARPRNAKELREFEEAQMWIMETDSGWIFSFESICSQLGLEPNYLRSGLKKIKAEARRGQPPCCKRQNRLPGDRSGVGRTALRLQQSQTSPRSVSADHR